MIGGRRLVRDPRAFVTLADQAIDESVLKQPPVNAWEPAIQRQLADNLADSAMQGSAVVAVFKPQPESRYTRVNALNDSDERVRSTAKSFLQTHHS